VSDAAADLRVPASDLRRLLWAKPQLQDAAFEVVEARIDKAEKDIAEALTSEDSRRRDAASFLSLEIRHAQNVVVGSSPLPPQLT
jgi:hypothetical protein